MTREQLSINFKGIYKTSKLTLLFFHYLSLFPLKKTIMIDFNQIFKDYNLILVDHFDFTKFLIVTTLCLITTTLYLHRRRKIAISRLKVVPKQTIIIHEEPTNTITTEAKPDIDEKENLDISSYGGFVPYLRKLHSDQGVYVSSKL